MKRLAMLVILGMLWTTSCFADAKELILDYKDMTYETSAGISKTDYRRDFRKLYVSTKKQEASLSPTEIAEFNDIIGVYNEALFFWDNHYPNVGSKGRKYLDDKYPTIKSHVSKNAWGDYDCNDVISFLWATARDKIKAFDDKLNVKP